MRVPSTILRLATLLFLGSVPLALAGCGDEPTSPDINPVVIGRDIGGGGGGGGTNPPPPSAPSISNTLTPSAPDGLDGWYRSNVSLAWTITDNTAGEPTYVGCEEPTVATDQDATDYPCSATNSVGTTGPVVVSIKRDATPPEVTVTGVAPGATYSDDAVPAAGCTTTDGRSGVATEATLQVSGGPTGLVTVTCDGATDNAGNVGTAQIQYQVTETNKPPVAAAGGPYTGNEGTAIALSAAGSTDPNQGDALAFAWDTDNDGEYDDGTGPTASVTYPDNGDFTVGVRVTDSKGASSTASAPVTVSNVAPTVNPVPALQIEAGEVFTVYVTATDPSQNDMHSPAGWRLCLPGSGSCSPGGVLLQAAGALPGVVFTETVSSNPGTYFGWVQVQDKDLGVSARVDIVLTVVPSTNKPPVAAAGGPYSGVEGIAIALSAAGSTDPNQGDVLTFVWDTDNDGEFDDATGPTTSVTYPDNGDFTVAVMVTDSRGASNSATASVAVTNADPKMYFSAPATIVEGTPITLSASNFIDASADAGSLQVTYSCDGGTTFGTNPGCPAVDGPATVNVVGRVTDKDGGSTSYPKTVSVTNVAPVIASLTLPITPVPVGTAVSLAASFADGWADDGHTTAIVWDDASSSVAVSVSTPGSVSAAHTYGAPGVYTVTLTVKDDAGAEDVEQHQYVVVYDPSAGFVTGGGWIAYGGSACPVLCGGAAGRGEFGFVSRYQKGATLPAGDTQFEFDAGKLRFESTEYEWLVVAGSRAQFKGRGRIGGSGDYGFLVTAIDGTTDAFRIKIWNSATSTVVFDNQWNADEAGSSATSLNKVSGGGSIVIRAK